MRRICGGHSAFVSGVRHTGIQALAYDTGCEQVSAGQAGVNCAGCAGTIHKPQSTPRHLACPAQRVQLRRQEAYRCHGAALGKLNCRELVGEIWQRFTFKQIARSRRGHRQALTT